ncbi:hypothetical protein D3C85_1585950 [compost metagenome]
MILDLLKLKFNSTSVGGIHLESSQTMNSTTPFTIETPGETLIICSKTVDFSKYLIFILNIGSSMVCPSFSLVLPFSLTAPLKVSYLKVVGIGPFSGTL